MGEVMSICRQVCAWLAQQGLDCGIVWPGTQHEGLTAPFVAVQVREYGLNDSGQVNYLGERYDEARANWVECYGRKMELSLDLAAYAPESAGEGELQEVVDRLTEVFSRSAPAGTKVGQITCGSTVWDKDARYLKRETAVELTAWLVAEAEEDTEFLDFELRGGWKI